MALLGDSAVNHLYFGDNLDVLRARLPDACVDLVYLDPPFNSQAQYNVFFRTKADDQASAQATAFRDTWTWLDGAEAAYDDIMMRGGSTARFVKSLRDALGDSDTMAYLVMMASRLHELQRVMKRTATLYLHCDPTASHYLKVICDGIFHEGQFLSEVIWKRTSAHNSARRHAPVHDVLLVYANGDRHTWNQQYQPYDATYVDAFYTHADPDGRRWRRSDLTGAGTRNGLTGEPWRGIDVTARGRHWAIPPSELDKLEAAGRVHWPKKADGMPMLKRYLEDQPGLPLTDVWTDIKPLHNLSAERTRYPTQKPSDLLKRIIQASSNRGDVILDPFCGCGTTIEAAEELGRQWIGIDVAYHAIKVIEDRLGSRFRGLAKHETLGIPTSYDDAVALAERDKFQFQWWANYLFDPHTLHEVKRGADRGIDGMLYFPRGPGRGGFDKLLMSVKGGRKLSPSMVRDFRGVLEREDAAMGIFICLDKPTQEMEREAVVAGYVDTAQGRKPRLQIFSIKSWFEGQKPDLPHAPQFESAAVSRRRRPKQRTISVEQPELPLTIAGGKSKEKGNIVTLNPARFSRGAA